jgi:hypothetical protein
LDFDVKSQHPYRQHQLVKWKQTRYIIHWVPRFWFFKQEGRKCAVIRVNRLGEFLPTYWAIVSFYIHAICIQWDSTFHSLCLLTYWFSGLFVEYVSRTLRSTLNLEPILCTFKFTTTKFTTTASALY